MAELYLFDKEIEEVDCRFDVVAIMFGDGGNPVIKALRKCLFVKICLI